MVRSPGATGRLVVGVVLVAAVVAAVLAAAIFVLVRNARLRDSLERARTEAVFDLRLAGPLLEGSTDLQQVVETFGEERGIDAILIKDGRTVSSDPAIRVTIPPELRDLAGRGQLGYDRVVVADTQTLLVGGPTPDREAELYFLFPEGRISDDLRQLGIALVIGWVAIVVVAFAFARVAGGRIETLAAAEAWGRRFTTDVSHELRTPVAALVSEASVLEQHLDRMPPDARRAAELLVGDVARLRRLVEDLTNLASLEAGREEVRVEPFDLGTLVDGTIRSRGWNGRLELRSQQVPVTTDRTRVDRIVANLIGNALEHGGDGVVVRVGRDEEGAFVDVADAGPGISPNISPTSSIGSTEWTGRARDPAAVWASRSRARTRCCWVAISRLGANPAPVRGSRSACRTIDLLPEP